LEVFVIPIATAVSVGLIWSRIPHKPGYELKSNGEVVASLQRTSGRSSEFQAEAQRGKWRFRRTGFWRPVTEIIDANSGVRIAGLKPNWGGGGTLVFFDGQTFRLTAKGFFRPVWSVLAEGGQPVLSIRSREKTVEMAGELHLSEDRLMLLAIFAWHIMQQVVQDAAAAAVVVAATS
jgi:hypothetical protein